jgi:hypothetical protein
VVKGSSICQRSFLSPLWGFLISHFHPRLTPWAAFLGRFAAEEFSLKL